MKHRKCEIIPVSVFDGGPSILFEDDTHKYHKSAKGRYLKITRKTCSQCAKTAMYVGIFKYKTHQRVERFCKEHAATFGTLPATQQEQQQAIPRWNSIKVRI